MNDTCYRLGPHALRKRDGRVVPFDIFRLQRALNAAGDQTGEFGSAMAWLLAQQIVVYLSDREALDAESVQDMMEEQLMEAFYFRTARACILYRERRREAGPQDHAA